MAIKKNNSGFSLVELIIVVTIVFISLIGIASLMLQNLQVETLNRNQLTASMLAQEGIELVRSVRDDNWLIRGNSWNQDLSDGDGTFIIDYRVNPDNRDIIDDSVDFVYEDGAKLYLDGDGYYSHEFSVIDTPFWRLVTIDDEGDYMLATVDVRWQGRFSERHYIINATLYNWRGQ